MHVKAVQVPACNAVYTCILHIANEVEVEKVGRDGS